MTAPKLTEAQREVLEQLASSKSGWEFERELFRSPSVGHKLVALGLAERYTDACCTIGGGRAASLHITDAGRAALRGES